MLKQPLHKPLPVEKQVLILYALTHGFLDSVPVDQILDFEEALYDYFDSHHEDIFETKMCIRDSILPERNRKDNLLADYGIVVKGIYTVIGSVDFNHRHDDDVLEIGYTLHPDYWGQGYVPEAVRALIDLTFKELGLHKIELACLGTMSKVNESQRSLVSPMKLA